MSRIRRLPDQVVNRIAAGEVVERPASVLKELLENAIDARASAVTADLRDAGRLLIRVTDDGEGMTPEEVELALERHATSKIATEEDLRTIRSLGFRGEALPAICAVSRFTITSVPAGTAWGTLLRGEGGVATERLEAEATAGTTVEIRDLFFNTPARLKFLKSPQSELAAALRVAQHLALAHPELHLRVTHNGRSVLTAPRATTLRDRVGSLLGHELAAELLEVRSNEGGAGLSGLLSPPRLSRGSRDWLLLIVNGRPVRDAAILETLVEAYRPLLARDRFPVAVLCVDVPPSEVDVNVHPGKAWIRFRQPRLVQESVFRQVQATLRSAGVVSPVGGVTRVAAPSPAPQSASPIVGAPGSGAPVDAVPVEHQERLFRESEAAYAPCRFGVLVGQLQETFLVSASDDEVFFIDQHVAHERVVFERLKAEVAAGPLASQELLFPCVLELGPAGRARLGQWLPTLADLGFSIEEFGSGAFVLRATPSRLRSEEPQRLIEGLLEEVGARPPGSPLLDRVLAFVACRAAIKAHQPLDRGEMVRLLQDLSASETPYFCPHGRPIVSRLSLKEIRRELRRSW
ncbi:MAG: DNA mismatch repair endonuclease MutL [Candidatus Rokubacteria bacterium]|nr:DNA mismatch repair endonuclease MutL [Candidatus Rokubacteria bacterium]